jgi:hypothetical protein
LIDPEHLDRAAVATVRGKRRRSDVAWFLFRREAELERLQVELASGTWRPSPPDLLSIRDPKPRLIARVPIADRIVQTALVWLIEPVFLRGLSEDAYACRPGRGTHRALLRLLELSRRHRYALHLDVRAYFPSIDRQILRHLLGHRIWDRRVLSLIDLFLDQGRGLYDDPEARAVACLPPDWPPPGRGLPIGAYTSQVFAAHIYLAGLDHWAKRSLKIPGFLRYVDDIFCFGDSRDALRRWREAIGVWLYRERHLKLKHPEARILSCQGHLDALGYRVTRQGVRALPRARLRLRRRLARELARPPWRCASLDIERSIASSAGVLLF